MPTLVWSAVEYQIDPIAERALDVTSRRWRELRRAIRARRREGNARRTEQCERHWIGRYAQRHRVESRRHVVRHDRSFR